jgi:sterol desaturase/sphingolipid hydroxylase (fatty acid hydroxylase superfamily)
MSTALVQPHRRFVTAAGLWIIVMAVGFLAVLAGPYVAYPTASAAKKALWSMAGGTLPGIAEVAALTAFVSVTLLKPLMIMGVISLLELWICPRYRTWRQFFLLWTTQTLFVAFIPAIVLVVAQLPWAPKPLISLEYSPGYFSLLPAAMLVASLLVTDLMIYWLHRAFHKFPLLWRFHRIHHSQDLDVVEDVVHPVEMIIVYVLVTVPLMFLVQVPGSQLYILAAFLSLTHHLSHSRLPINLGRFGILYADNRFHFVHHGLDPETFNSNFSPHFPFVDMLFGTYRAPQGEGLPATGLREHSAPRSLRQYLLAELPPAFGAERRANSTPP